jgi:hypothetical protein
VLRCCSLHGCKLWKLFAVRLRNIENECCTEAYKLLNRELYFRCGIVFDFPFPDYWGKNGNALFTFANEAAQFVPGVETRNVRCSRTLKSNQQAIVPGILVKPRHHGKVILERFTLTGFESLDQNLKCVRR